MSTPHNSAQAGEIAKTAAAEGAGDEPVVEPVSDEHAEAPAEG